MKKIIILSLSIFLLVISCSKKRHNTLTKKEKQAGWQLLFDGKSTNGWHGYLEDGVGKGWLPKDGNLYCKGLGGDIGGDIITDKNYDDFILKLEWKISKGGNSGIFYHVIEDRSYSAPYMTGPEYQIIDDVGFDGPLQDWQKAGADYAMYVPNDKKELKPQGEWNSTKIVFNDGHVEHWLNGKKIIEFEAWSDDWKERKENGKWKDYPGYGMSKTGHIGLQDHGDEAWFRNIKIKKLEE